jgi:hypothetical protein
MQLQKFKIDTTYILKNHIYEMINPKLPARSKSSGPSDYPGRMGNSKL